MIGRIMPSLVVLRILVIVVVIVTGSAVSNIRDAEIDRILKKLNKPFLKSIKSPDGDIIDCVHMKNHPIYDHPLFKNHTIQMKPSSYPEGWNINSSYTKKQNMVTQLWTINGSCPKYSIPIIRTRKRDILRAGSIERYVRKHSNDILQLKPSNSRTRNKHEYAIFGVRVNSSQAKFHGTKANINVWKPYVQTKREFSLAQIWVSAGNDSTHSQLQTVEAGWHVYKKINRDRKPRYFVYWTADGYRRTGCYNTRCSGFVLTNRGFALGGVVPRVSVFDGPQQEIPTTIWKDPFSGHWWLAFDTHLIVGYWPSSLFNTLRDGATRINWGGEIVNLQQQSQHTSTQMGSGHFAQEGRQKASYFKNIEVIYESMARRQPENPFTYASDPTCYNIAAGIHNQSGVFFYYGGPGRNPNCN